MQELNKKIESISQGRTGEILLEALDTIIQHIADARNGEWDIETRKSAINAINEMLYNKVKAFRANQNNTKKDEETWI